MTDQQEQPSPVVAPTPGEYLRQERQRQGRTVQQIASDLHIGAYMIEAIERNQFAVLGAPVFARGHLRKYATLLGLPVERVQELYQTLSDRPQDEDPVPAMHRATDPSIRMSPDSKQRRTLQRPAKWTFIIAGGALLIAGLVAWLIHKDSKPAIPEKETTAVIPAATGNTSTAAESTPIALPTAVNNAANTPTKPNASFERGQVGQATMPTTSPAVSPAVSPVARGKLRLRFSFNRESWVEVYDVRGTRLLYDVGFSGQTRGVDVDPPAQVVLGQATAVSTEVNGRAVTVPTRRIANQVARFTVGADGAAQ